MKHIVGRSSNNVILEAVSEATKDIQAPKLVLFYSSTEHFKEYATCIHNKYPNSIVMGSTTYAAFTKEGALKNGLAVVGIESGIECYGDVIEEVEKYPIKYVERIQSCIKQIGNTSNTVCFQMVSGLIGCEELVLSTFNTVLEDKKIPLFGGTAGDYGKAEKTMVSMNGKVYENACVFVIIKNLGGKIRLYRENIYKPTKHHFTATKVDVKNRIVEEYNNQAAALVVSKALNTTVEGLQKYLDTNPLGRIIGNEMYITANQQVTEKNGMQYHARIYKNDKLVLLEPDDYKKVIKDTLDKVTRDIPSPSFTLVINCLARSILFDSDGYLHEFAKGLGRAVGDYIGFAGYGEQLDQQHFNQTMVIATFE